MPKIITLLTDFGLQDEFVGVMKGVIWGIAPQAHIADITHVIQPQNILHGALVLGRALPYFPPGSIHLAVVDPGVGTHRRGIALQVGEHTFVGPDNGLFTIPLNSGEPVQAVSLDNPAYQLHTLSRSFHGRDLFAPAAAHLARGVPLSEFGAPVTRLVKIEIPRPLRIANIWQAQVMLVDSFGNLITNLSGADLAGQMVVQVTCQGENIPGLSETFGGSQPGSLIAMLDSSDSLSLCLVNSSAAKHLAAGPGTTVEVRVAELPAG
ncbi:MAG: SAM hydrolase/SAM-dependent halogenase family protein [Bellilinea sp.]